MFLGHLGLAFGAKKFTPPVSLGTLFLATQFQDLLMNALLLVGIEKVKIRPAVDHYNLINPASLHATVPATTPVSYPLEFVSISISHSFLTSIVIAAVIGGILYLNGHKLVSCLIVAGLSISHWVLDVLVHYPDLPLFPGSNSRFGFALWESADITIFLEAALFLTGVALYMRYSYAKNKKGKYGIWVLIALLVIYHYCFVHDPAPRNVYVFAITGQIPWLFVAMAYWISKNRGILKRID